MRGSLLMGAIASVLLSACGSGAPDAPKSVTVFHGGKIYTGQADSKTVPGVVVDSNGRILALDANVPASWGVENVDMVNLNGAVMYPGFVDGHAHLGGIGQREMMLNLEGTASINALIVEVGGEVNETAAGEMVFGRGWIETGWPEGRMPRAADLDGVSPDNPVILVRADGHALVANSAALKAAGINRDTKNPVGGAIERDRDGNATGILIDNAMGLAMQLVAKPSEAQAVAALEKGGEVYAARGWTGMHNMSAAPADAPRLEALDAAGRMPIRLHNAYDVEGWEVAQWRQHETDTIQNRAIKIYMDGALGSRGALLTRPYSDRPETSGLALTQPDALADLMTRADTGDVQLAMHAIGDLANRRILDAYETAGFGADKRWRIEHTQILHPDDIGRVGALGLIASMQPSHAIGDLKFAPARLGQKRLAGAYAWQSLLDTDARLVGGSDAPVEVGSPMIEFYAAVARKGLDGTSGEGWHPEQALTREQALALFTSGPAYASFQEKDLGTIAVGKLADFSVFSGDLMTLPEADLLTVTPVMTIVGGEVVWRAN